MSTKPGAAEYRALTDALGLTTPPCHNDWRFVQERDEIDDDDLVQMQRLCTNVCPLTALCGAYATTARPNAGMWAGRYYSRAERTQK